MRSWSFSVPPHPQWSEVKTVTCYRREGMCMCVCVTGLQDVKANCITPFPLPLFSLMAHIRMKECAGPSCSFSSDVVKAYDGFVACPEEFFLSKKLEELERRQSESEGDRESEGGSLRHRSESIVSLG
ncbi:hypothetical protein Q8A67_012770 [Cirrhinus molitorella]|uniref:Uncharacterized protein n=1 Tax=Cirrhinus molitorella TaxID=172907 RepID=A0AA88PPV4_9TELE|nr:hypothetical protein Q8A67_012770 [Cirrhinus molitorella]